MWNYSYMFALLLYLRRDIGMHYTAQKIMTAPAISVAPETKLKEVVNVMAEHNISGVPVIDAEGKVVGIISETDIVKYAGKTQAIRFISPSGWICPYGEITEGMVYRKGFELLASTTAKTVMAKKVITVRGDASGLEIARIMSRRKINRVPVVDGDGRLLGLITRADLVRSFAERGEK